MPWSAAVFCADASDSPSSEVGLNGEDPEQSYVTEHDRWLLHITQYAKGDNIYSYDTDCIKLTCLIKLARLLQNTMTRESCALCTSSNPIWHTDAASMRKRQVYAKSYSKILLFCQVHQLLSHLRQDSGALSHILKVLSEMEGYTIYHNQLHLGKQLILIHMSTYRYQ